SNCWPRSTTSIRDELYTLDFAGLLVWRRPVLWRRSRTGCVRCIEIVWSTKRERDCRIDSDAFAVSHQYRRLCDRVAAVAESNIATKLRRSCEFYPRVHLRGGDRTNDCRRTLGDRRAHASLARGDGSANRSDCGGRSAEARIWRPARLFG